MFTRQHFEKVAEVIKSVDDEVTKKQLEQKFSRIFKESNKRFNRKQFKKACGLS